MKQKKEFCCGEEVKPFLDIARLEQASHAGNDYASLQLAEGYRFYEHDYETCWKYLNMVSDPTLIDNVAYRKGCLYARGLGVAQDIDRAIKCFESITDKELKANALCQAGVLYCAKKSLGIALKIWNEAADMGNWTAVAYRTLCLMASGVELTELSEDIDAVKRGAEQDDALCTFVLAELYHSGLCGFSKDDTLAFSLYRKAAVLGEPNAILQIISFMNTGAFTIDTLEDFEKMIGAIHASFHGDRAINNIVAFSSFFMIQHGNRTEEEKIFDRAVEVLYFMATEYNNRVAKILLLPIFLENQSGNEESQALAQDSLKEIDNCETMQEWGVAITVGTYFFLGRFVPRDWKKSYKIFTNFLAIYEKLPKNFVMKSQIDAIVKQIVKYRRIILFFHPSYKKLSV